MDSPVQVNHVQLLPALALSLLSHRLCVGRPDKTSWAQADNPAALSIWTRECVCVCVCSHMHVYMYMCVYVCAADRIYVQQALGLSLILQVLSFCLSGCLLIIFL